MASVSGWRTMGGENKRVNHWLNKNRSHVHYGDPEEHIPAEGQVLGLQVHSTRNRQNVLRRDRRPLLHYSPFGTGIYIPVPSLQILLPTNDIDPSLAQRKLDYDLFLRIWLLI